MEKQDKDSGRGCRQKLAHYYRCSLMSCGCSQPVLPLSLCISLTTIRSLCTLLLPHELQAASIENKGSSCASSSFAQFPKSFSSAVSAARGAQQLSNLFLILCRLNWMERNFMNVDPELKKSRLQHVHEGQWQRQSLWFVHRLHFLSQEVQQHDPTFC